MTIGRLLRMGLVTAVVVALGLAVGSAADRPEGPDGQQPGAKPFPKELSPGASACPTCHSGADQRGVRLYVANYKSHEFVKLDESVTWMGEDVHSLAFRALSGPLGRQIGTVLKVDVTRTAECLTCHAVDLTPTAPLAQKQFFVNQGVNCNGCHGLKEAWQLRHYKETADGSGIAWRASTPSDKAEAGLTDLRNPTVKAKLCASCHVGDPDQGRVVTHAMYAAGHPPLPPFELATYLEGEPRHWGYPTELPYFKTVPADKTWGLYHFLPPDREVYKARAQAAGAVAGLHAEARLLHAEAEAALKSNAAGIDFARFDCYACHHELSSPSARQARGYPDGPPGRPTLRHGAGLLAGVVARNAEGIEAGGLKARAAGFAERWMALRHAAAARPYGDPKAVVSASRDVIAWCEGVLNVLGDCPDPIYPQGQADRLERLLTAAAADPSAADPETAFCLAWAYITLRGAPSLPADKLKQVGEVVPLTIRGQPFSRTEDGRPAPIPPRVAERMKATQTFTPNLFLGPFRELGAPR